jgi:hypothetical protein
MKKTLIAAVAAAALGLAGCGSDDGGASSSGSGGQASLPQGSEHVRLDPAEFTPEIDHLYWPMKPGSRWVYDEVEDGERLRVEVTVTDRTKVIDGIEARVVRDVVSKPNGEPARWQVAGQRRHRLGRGDGRPAAPRAGADQRGR